MKYLTKKDIKKLKHVSLLNLRLHIHVIKLDNKKYMIQREGKCEPEKCGSICCKFFHLGSIKKKDYENNFGEKAHQGRILRTTCNKLCRGKCSIWKKDIFPKACIEFPHPHDPVYYESLPLCSFKFKKIYEVKDVVV